jgi:MFS family permease
MSQPPQDRPPGEVQDAAPGSPMPGYDHGGEAGSGSEEHRLGTMAFVLGIISVVGMPLFGPFAWVLGRRAVREIDTSTVTAYRNRGIAVAGMVLGIVGTVLLLLLAAGFVAVVALFVLGRSRA